MIRSFRTTIRLCAIAAAALAGGAMAQQQNDGPVIQAEETVAATVNDHMISTFDVRQRMQLMLVTSGGRISPEALPQLQRQALQDLVEERLKLLEAERLEFDIDPEEVADEIARIAASSNVTVPQLEQQLLAQGIAPETVEEQIRARLVWQRLVSARYRNRVSISDDEIDEVMERLRADSRKEQYLLSEICLPVDDESQIEQVKQAGLQMIGQMRQGAPFGAIANQFSVCPSAAAGGDLGWVRSGELAPEIDSIVQQLDKGSVSIPTYHDGLVYLIAMRDKRDAAQGGIATYDLAYASAPVSLGEARAREAFRQLSVSNICDSRSLNIDLGEQIGFALVPQVTEADVEAPFREPLAALERGTLSAPIEADGYYHAMFLCEKDEGLGLPSRDQIKDRLFAQELSLISRRYLRDVRRDAAVDIRYSEMAENTGITG